MFCCTNGEQALKARFEEAYLRSQSPIMKVIERRVCGCDYGGNSWTTREQADALILLLKLDSSKKLIDVGAGSGWPGIYLAKNSGCSVTLVDLPEVGLRIAKERAQAEGIEDRVIAEVADASDLPYADQYFDAVGHSDLLCCLVRKRRALEECKRVVRKGGTMAFTVIYIAPGLPRASRTRARKNAPDFVETDMSYPDLLIQTGWTLVERQDLTAAYRDSCARQVEADHDNRTELAELLGDDEAAVRLAQWRSKLSAIEDGLFVRELFVCRREERVGAQ